MSSLTLNSNPASLGAQRQLGKSTGALERTFERLSSGLRINRASDDAAGLAIASGLNVDRRVFAQGVRNLGNGDGTFTSGQGIPLPTNFLAPNAGDFNGNGVLDLAVLNPPGGEVIILLADTADGVAPLLPFSLKSRADAKQAMSQMDQALGRVSLQRGTVGAFQSRLVAALSTVTAATENLAAAESRIRDADIAEESANLVKNQILQQAGAAVLGQANQAPARALTLLQG